MQNWANEIVKWLGGKLNVLAIDSGTKKEIDNNLGKLNWDGYYALFIYLCAVTSESYITIVTRSREMNHMSKIETFTPLSGNLKMLHFDANPIRNGYLVTEISMLKNPI